MHLARWIFLGLTLGGLACHAGDKTVPDLDGDGFPADQDCDDSNAQVWRTAQVYVDQDGDGHGTGESLPACVGSSIMVGLAEVGDDCDDGNPAVWSGRLVYPDHDGDGYGTIVGYPVLACQGAPPPPGYAESDGDCNDEDASRWQTVSLYLDSDLDGFGSGEPVSVCAGAAEPEGYSARGGDCAPDDGTRWQELPYLYRDADGDGYTVASEGVVCSGAALPAGYSNEPRGVDCDDAAPSLFQNVSVYVDADLDGHGTGPAVTVCASGDFLPAGYARDDTDCAPYDQARWQMLDYLYADHDLDGHFVTEVGRVCAGWSYPAEYTGYTYRDDDCDDTNKTVWSLSTVYRDVDEDGVGAGVAEQICSSSTPKGYSALSSDCAPDDPTRWRPYAYRYRDADGDGYTVYEPGTVCIGDSVPGGYDPSGSKGSDCDDSSPSGFRSVWGYLDADGDGVGAGQLASFCTDGALPTGYVSSGTDCAPDDPTRWATLKYAQVDRDGDGYTAPEAGEVCTGAALPDPYRATANGNDCNDGDPTLYQWVVLYQDKDGDGIGAPPRAVQCLADTLPAGWSIFGWDVDDANKAVHWTGDEEDELLLAQP